jgi:hypothetical protein
MKRFEGTLTLVMFGDKRDRRRKAHAAISFSALRLPALIFA